MTPQLEELTKIGGVSIEGDILIINREIRHEDTLTIITGAFKIPIYPERLHPDIIRFINYSNRQFRHKFNSARDYVNNNGYSETEITPLISTIDQLENAFNDTVTNIAFEQMSTGVPTYPADINEYIRYTDEDIKEKVEALLNPKNS